MARSITSIRFLLKHHYPFKNCNLLLTLSLRSADVFLSLLSRFTPISTPPTLGLPLFIVLRMSAEKKFVVCFVHCYLPRMLPFKQQKRHVVKGTYQL